MWVSKMTLCYNIICRGDTGLCPVNHLNTCPETGSSVTNPACDNKVRDVSISPCQHFRVTFTDRLGN